MPEARCHWRLSDRYLPHIHGPGYFRLVPGTDIAQLYPLKLLGPQVGSRGMLPQEDFQHSGINSAGVARYGPIKDFDDVAWDHTLDVNLASDAGLIGVPNLAVCCASKAGVVNITHALALELAPDASVRTCVAGAYGSKPVSEF